MIRIVATDLDGTLLRSEYQVSTRTVEALGRVQEAGALVVPVTARPPRMTTTVASEFGITGVAICGNGSILLDLATQEIIEHRPLDVGLVRRVIEVLREAAPGVAFACEDGLSYRCEPGYPTVVPPELRTICDALEFAATPISKLIAKHQGMDPAELIELARGVVGAGATVENSGPEWVEVHAIGVNKGAMLADLAALHGAAASEVVAFGDYRTDVPMLGWAGLGVAPANAHPDALAAADEVCAPNDEDGVAQVLERLLADGRIGGI